MYKYSKCKYNILLCNEDIGIRFVFQLSCVGSFLWLMYFLLILSLKVCIMNGTFSMSGEKKFKYIKYSLFSDL